MPITPFHFGPGAAIKAAAPSYFSFTVFCFAQVVTDCETAYYLFQGMYPVHRFFHTYLGATFVGFGSLIIGRPLCQWALRILNGWRDGSANSDIPIRSAVAGAFIGTYSHVFLDSIMHPDILPLMPFSPANPLRGIVSLYTLHLSCLILGCLGVIGLAIRSKTKPSKPL